MKITSEGKNHKAINLGSFDQLGQHSFLHPKFKTENKGRIFVGELLETNGAEISFREMPGNTTVPFLHKHNEHEEIYVFLKGMGEFQVDDEVFKVEEGSVVKVASNGSRTLSNTSEEVMIYMVVQATQNTLKGYDVSDGYRVDGAVKI